MSEINTPSKSYKHVSGYLAELSRVSCLRDLGSDQICDSFGRPLLFRGTYRLYVDSQGAVILVAERREQQAKIEVRTIPQPRSTHDKT